MSCTICLSNSEADCHCSGFYCYCCGSTSPVVDGDAYHAGISCCMDCYVNLGDSVFGFSDSDVDDDDIVDFCSIEAAHRGPTDQVSRFYTWNPLPGLRGVAFV